MAKEIIICCDGTGNSKEAADIGGEWAGTNVQLISELLLGHATEYPGLLPVAINRTCHNHEEGWDAYEAKLASGTTRLVYYDRGLGAPTLDHDGETQGFSWNPLKFFSNLLFFRSKLQEARSQTFARGIMHNVEQAYKYLVDNYEPGDKVFLFGFSRGSYTQLLLVNLIHHLGLIDKHKFKDPRVLKEKIIYGLNLYKKLDDHQTDLKIQDQIKCVPNQYKKVDFNESCRKLDRLRDHLAHTDPQIISFLGLFDMVRGLVIEHVHDDTKLSPIVKVARHAVSIDERRRIFKPQLYVASDATDSEQVWFPGVHCDVGGGYANRGLADIALHWMLDAAKTHAGLEIQQGFLDKLKEKLDHTSQEHDSLNTPIKYVVEWGAVSKEYRRPLLTTTSEKIHASAFKRFRATVKKANDAKYEYKPANLAHAFTAISNSINIAREYSLEDNQAALNGWQKKIPDPDTLSDAGEEGSLVRKPKHRSTLHLC